MRKAAVLCRQPRRNSLVLQVNLRPARHNPGRGIMEIVRGLLCMGSGAEDSALVVLQNADPFGDVGSMVLADFRSNSQIGAQESARKLRHKLLAGVAFVSPLLAAHIAVEP